jgi:hypothetical protein
LLLKEVKMQQALKSVARERINPSWHDRSESLNSRTIQVFVVERSKDAAGFKIGRQGED